MTVDVYVGLGSNLLNPESQISQALVAISKLPETQLLNASSLYGSKPMGPSEQPDYVNAVVMLRTKLSPDVLLKHLQKIENEQGRIRKENRWGPRTLDLDIILYGLETIEQPDLTIPHYGCMEREFVLYPLAEIAPDLIFPCGTQLQRVLANVPRNGLKVITSVPKDLN